MVPTSIMTLSDLQRFLDAIPLHRTQPLKAVKADAESETVQIKLSWRPEYGNSLGIMHGGVIATLIDTTAACALLTRGRRAGPTINLRVDYLKAIREGTDVIAEGKVRRSGRTLAFVDVEVRDDAQALYALGRANYVAEPVDLSKSG